MDANNSLLFEVMTPLGFAVRCTVEYWQAKVVADHPVMAGREEAVRRTLAEPAEIRLVCVVARRLNGDGFLITAYPTDVVKKGTKLWPV